MRDAAATSKPVTPVDWATVVAVGAAGGAGWAIGEYLMNKLLKLVRGSEPDPETLSDEEIATLLAQYESSNEGMRIELAA